MGGCSDPIFGRIWCAYHYNRWLRTGDPQGGPRRRSKRRKPGERVQYSDGYIRVHGIDHPNARNGIVLEHVLVMAEQLGRPIRNEETVHHRNGIKHDNALSNLELWASKHPPGQRVEDLVAFAREILNTYGDEF